MKLRKKKLIPLGLAKNRENPNFALKEFRD